jgi:hypothetical protein
MSLNTLDAMNLALSRLSTFGKLLLLADLRDRSPDPLAERLHGKEQTQAALQQKHREIFLAWLGLNLAAQMTEVAEYLTTHCGNHKAQLVQQWVDERLYEKLIPAAASEGEWVLFTSDLRIILQLLEIRFDPSEESCRG